MDSSSKIEETASDWIIKRASEEWNQAAQTELDEWLTASTANKVAFIRLETAWKKAHRLKALASGAHSDSVPAPGAWVFSPFFADPSFNRPALSNSAPQLEATTGARPRRVRWLALAASVLGVVSISSWYLWPEGTAYRTEIGGIQAVPMADGSRVTLNTASKIRVAVSDRDRRVKLEQGEAFFEVVKDPRRPFIVEAGNKRIVVVGTAFSVRREGSDVQVVVTDGRVRIDGETHEAAENRSQAGSGTLLAAGAIAHTTNNRLVVEESTPRAAEEELSWRSGFLVFRETALVDAVAEFNRYSARKMVVEDPDSLDAVHVGGTFRSTNVDAFVRLLEQGFEMEATRADNEIRLRKR